MRAAMAVVVALALGGCSEDAATGASDALSDGGDPYGTDAATDLGLEDGAQPDGGAPGDPDGTGKDPLDAALADGGDGGDGGAPDPDARPDADSGQPDSAGPGDVTGADGGGPDGADAADTSPPEPAFEVTVVTTTTFDPWVEVQHLSLESEGIEPDPFVPKATHPDQRIVDAFGGDSEPPTSDFLLHVGPGCGTGEPALGQVVVLVPGAGSDAQLSFVAPMLIADGLAVDLIDHGYCVFAVTFAHPFGRNQSQALVLAAAIEQARLRTGQPRVQLIGHSKGGIVALTYVSGLIADKGAAYAFDVQQLYLLATPLGGMDSSFRHPNFNYAADVWALPMPNSWDMLLELGVWKDITDESIYGEAFRGVAQLLSSWIDAYPLSMLEQDWYTTWYGGYGFVSHSLGIDAAIALGGDPDDPEPSVGFMARLRAGTVPLGIEVHVGAGANPLVNGVAWETAGPSDGLVFVDSATDTTMLPPDTEVEVFSLLHHWDMVGSAPVRKWVRERLP